MYGAGSCCFLKCLNGNLAGVLEDFVFLPFKVLTICLGGPLEYIAS